MIAQGLEAWMRLPLPQAWVVAVAVQCAIYATLAGGFAALHAGLQRFLGWGEVIEKRPLRKNQVRTEMAWSLLTCAIYAAFTVLGTRLASGALPASWSQGFWQLAALVVWYDFLTYWSHRLLHTRPFVRFHRVHHRSVRATPWSVYCVHPVEATINQLQVIGFMLLWPTSLGVMLLFQACAMLGGAIGHGNFDPFADRGWLALPKRFYRFHQRHHTAGRDNFGFAGPHWDAVFGTAEPATPAAPRPAKDAADRSGPP